MVCGKSNLKKKQRFDEEPKRAKMPYFMQTSKAWKSNLEYNPKKYSFWIQTKIQNIWNQI